MFRDYKNIKRVLIVVAVAWSYISYGQQPFFLDSLFTYDLSSINDVNYKRQMSEIERLKKDYNLEVGLNVSNSIQDEFDTGLSTRLYARMNVLSGGYYDSLKEAEAIQNQIKIDSISGIKKAISHNYSLYYNYILYLFNIEKLTSIDEILTESKNLESKFQTLYFNKLIDYNEILFTQNIYAQFDLLRSSQNVFNQMFFDIIKESSLPKVNTEKVLDVDFIMLFKMIDQDSSQQEILNLKQEMLYIDYDRVKSPSFGFSAGYDFSRHRPFFSANFAVDIQPKVKQDFASKKFQIENDQRLINIEKKKEILNLQYEYKYKEKQLEGLFVKLRRIDELQRKYHVKKDVLNLEESLKEKKLKLERLIVKYEMQDIKSQLMILLLQIKKVVPMILLEPCINNKAKYSKSKKFAGNRYILKTDDLAISKVDQHFLTQNEITLIEPLQLLELENTNLIYPGDFQIRAEFEEEIIRLIENKGVQHFIINDFDSFKKLELKTIEQQRFQLTSVLK